MKPQTSSGARLSWTHDESRTSHSSKPVALPRVRVRSSTPFLVLLHLQCWQPLRAGNLRRRLSPSVLGSSQIWRMATRGRSARLLELDRASLCRLFGGLSGLIKARLQLTNIEHCSDFDCVVCHMKNKRHRRSDACKVLWRRKTKTRLSELCRGPSRQRSRPWCAVFHTPMHYR